MEAEHFQLNYIKLAYRAESLFDIEAVNANFNKKIEPKDGYFRAMHWEQMGIFPDFNVRFELAVWTSSTEESKNKLTLAVKSFIESIEECDDCHVIRQTLNYESEYSGKREYDDYYIRLENNMLVGIDSQMKMVDPSS